MNETVQSTPAAVTAGTTQPVDAQPAQAPQGSMLGGFLPIILIFGVFYFMMIRPQQRKEKERQKMIAALRAGRRVSFAGGLIGTIVEAKDETFVIEICSGTTVEVARGAVVAALDLDVEQK
ncbi:MAG: preprotein translocase subunit YajC [Kiritimatiellae bacterium]|nr:preprotein translocase subunit YajC [Kiritimatiellia bacterium]MBR4946412.1 preprotein translocase subunit YajC [Kiritimatiellia bacterium]MBR5587633.1 preprotein translocase subunit YajC [Kiritimatiellia bacterium]